MTNLNPNVGKGYGNFRSRAGWDLHKKTGVSVDIAGRLADMSSGEARAFIKFIEDITSRKDHADYDEDYMLVLWGLSRGKLDVSD